MYQTVSLNTYLRLMCDKEFLVQLTMSWVLLCSNRFRKSEMNPKGFRLPAESGDWSDLSECRSWRTEQSAPDKSSTGLCRLKPENNKIKTYISGHLWLTRLETGFFQWKILTFFGLLQWWVKRVHWGFGEQHTFFFLFLKYGNFDHVTLLNWICIVKELWLKWSFYVNKKSLVL